MKCRICYNPKLDFVYSLGKIAISNFTATPQKGKKYPITLVYCNSCKLLQLGETTPRDLLYKNYWYESHINPVIEEDLKEIAQLCKGYVISIGENDGSLLKHVKSKVKIGVDPSNIPHIYENCTWFNDYWENYEGNFQVDTIIAIACLYDLPNPNTFIKKVKDYLSPDGVFISQLMTLQPMIETNDIGNICHEHLEYYSYYSLVTLFEQNGLEIFKVEKNNINGGSYRIFARHFKKGSIKFKEKEYTLEDFKAFFRRVEENKDRMLKFLKDHKDVYVLGASTKQSTIMQYYQINSKMIRKVLEVNPAKIGKYTISSGIEIVPEEEIINTNCVWIGPWGFTDFFISKHQDWMKNGGKFIVISPQFKIYENIYN